jgi:glycosyltransferase involved in cell wall biosynthesis
VATLHDVIPYINPKSSTALDWLIYRFWLPLAVRQLDAVITDSQQSRQDILRFLPVNPEKVSIIPAAANRQYHPMSRDEIQTILSHYAIDYPYILYVGSIEPRKNLVRLLQAYARLRSTASRRHLVIVGAQFLEIYSAG